MIYNIGKREESKPDERKAMIGVKSAITCENFKLKKMPATHNASLNIIHTDTLYIYAYIYIDTDVPKVLKGILIRFTCLR